jgi:hypothetical protein
MATPHSLCGHEAAGWTRAHSTVAGAKRHGLPSIASDTLQFYEHPGA